RDHHDRTAHHRPVERLSGHPPRDPEAPLPRPGPVLGVGAVDRGAPDASSDHGGAHHDPSSPRRSVQEAEVAQVRLALREGDHQDLAQVMGRGPRSAHEPRQPNSARPAALPWAAACSMAGFVFVAVFLFYELIYRVRHFSLPLGFDAPWYVWRAAYVASRPLGPLGTNARPGHEVLSGDLQSATGSSALPMHVVVSSVLV